jgi:hypothetical protein
MRQKGERKCKGEYTEFGSNKRRMESKVIEKKSRLIRYRRREGSLEKGAHKEELSGVEGGT